jgi:hypothetical protein
VDECRILQQLSRLIFGLEVCAVTNANDHGDWASQDNPDPAGLGPEERALLDMEADLIEIAWSAEAEGCTKALVNRILGQALQASHLAMMAISEVEP